MRHRPTDANSVSRAAQSCRGQLRRLELPAQSASSWLRPCGAPASNKARRRSQNQPPPNTSARLPPWWSSETSTDFLQLKFRSLTAEQTRKPSVPPRVPADRYAYREPSLRHLNRNRRQRSTPMRRCRATPKTRRYSTDLKI